MDVVALTFTDRRLLAARYDEHGNSHSAMRAKLVADGHSSTVTLLDGLREIERTFDLDLGLVCHLYEHRMDPDRHPIEKIVVAFITDVQAGDPAAADADGSELLWILPDRVRQVRALMHDRLVGERE